MSVLSVRHLSKSYRSRQVVKDVSLTIHGGEIVGLLGPNGAGKTTSFHMIVGLINSDEGTIHINNQEISGLPMDQRSHLGLGYLPQEASIFRKLTVEENIMAILQTRPNLSENKAKQRLENLLREFHITHLRDNIGVAGQSGLRRDGGDSGHERQPGRNRPDPARHDRDAKKKDPSPSGARSKVTTGC